MSHLYFVAGESSGDLHGANLLRALHKLDPELTSEGLGGQQMAAAGMSLRYDLADHAIMGFVEVVKSFPMIRRVFTDTVLRLDTVRPDALVLIDYPGFNLRLAAKAKKMGIPVIYYISPQVWAWKRGRIRTIARTVDKMLSILPFEEQLFRSAGVDCTYVGHPLLDEIAATPITGMFKGKCVVGLLPGSRQQEIGRLMPVMAEVARGILRVHPDAQFVTPCVNVDRERQVRRLAGDLPLETTIGKSYEVLSAARFCLVASGTATLETALFGVPMAILYKMSPVSFSIAKRLVHVDHIGLVNILAGGRIVPEFVQDDATAEKILPVALELIDDTGRRKRMRSDIALLRGEMGKAGASDRAARAILDVLAARGRGAR